MVNLPVLKFMIWNCVKIKKLSEVKVIKTSKRRLHLVLLQKICQERNLFNYGFIVWKISKSNSCDFSSKTGDRNSSIIDLKSVVKTTLSLNKNTEVVPFANRTPRKSYFQDQECFKKSWNKKFLYWKMNIF